MAKNKFVTMRVEQEVYDYLKRMAEREHRTVTNLLALIMIKAIEKDKEENGENI